MTLLIIFAFLAGIVTILSPCILPILPIILSSTLGGKDRGKSHPVGIIIGFIASFTFFTLFLSSLVKAIGISPDFLRNSSVFIIGLMGLAMLIPQVQNTLEIIFSKLASKIPNGQNSNIGFSSGLVIGFSLGLLWTPCVGPILASVISLAISGSVNFSAFLITIFYSLGTAIPMFIILISGRAVFQKIPWLLSKSGLIQKIFGFIMMFTAIGIFYNLDRQFQVFILSRFPQYGTNLTRFEENDLVQTQIKKLNETDSVKLLKKNQLAPKIIAGGEWLNLPSDGDSQTLSLETLKGKVVLVDFWTYTCINCIRTLPYLVDWNTKYLDKGLVIIGVHTPEFEFEKNLKNVQKAVKDFGITYPVVQDNNFATWKNYNNNYWPAKYLIDKDGYVRYTHFGEGEYDKTELAIQELLKEINPNLQKTDLNTKTYNTYGRTPETYLGVSRGDYSLSTISQEEKIINFKAPKSIGKNEVAFEGDWVFTKEFANPKKGSKLFLNFDAMNVYLVMKSISGEAKIKVFVDDKQEFFGEDNQGGEVTVSEDRLYRLINLSEPRRHILKLEFLDDNAELFAFTFG